MQVVTFNSNVARKKTTLFRKTKTVQLNGNFVVKQRVPDVLLAQSKLTSSEEFTHMRYSAVTCDPDDFVSSGYDIRPALISRPIELFVIVTLFNEDESALLRTLFALSRNIQYLSKKTKYGWGPDAWTKVIVCIVADGRSHVSPNVLKVLQVLGLYQEGLAQASVNGNDTIAHLFEFTSQITIDESMNVWGSNQNIQPMQSLFCLKEKNAKKINSHRWAFNAFCPLVEPRVCVLIDVGTRPHEASLYRLWKTFYRNDQIAGACGEIRADLGSGMDYFKSIMNPLVASQNFEYKISNLLDKSLESTFGYISVLPGAFSAYRYDALKNTGPGSGPLAKYFEGESRKGMPHNNSIFSANLYLAEDRILCFELVAKKGSRWTLHYVSKAYAETDVPHGIPEFLSQRRRWLNGSMFAGFYALANIGRIWATDHSFPRKLAFTIQYLYNLLNQLFGWFILGNFAVTFYYLCQELEILLLGTPTNSDTSIGHKLVSFCLGLARFSYPVVLISLFIISFGNRPQAFRRVYKVVVIGFGIIGAGMMALLIQRLVQLIQTQLSLSSTDTNYAQYFDGMTKNASFATSDDAQKMLNTMLLQVNRGLHLQVQQNLASSQQESLIFVIALASTVGVYFVASIVQMDATHIFASSAFLYQCIDHLRALKLAQCLVGNKVVYRKDRGSSKAEALPCLYSSPTPDGKAVANISVALDRSDINAHYLETKTDLTFLSSQKPLHQVNPETELEDEYKAFRTSMMLFYVASNGMLFILATQTGTWIYIAVLLASIAGLSAIKLLGVLVFLILKLFTELPCLGARRKWNKTRQQAPWAASGPITRQSELDLSESRLSLDSATSTLNPL